MRIGIRWRGLVRDLACLAVVTLVVITHLSAVTLAQSIAPDGRTDTQLHVAGSVTDVTTGSVRGENAFNSFSRFDVDSGRTVNLHLPVGTKNLLNIVTSDRTDIHGQLNAVQDGAVGGNVYFANPHGFVVGADGVVNVGSLSVSTSSQAFVDSFFVAPSDNARRLLEGTAPLSGDGVISIQGTVNVQRDVALHAVDIFHDGTTQSAAVFEAGGPDFATVVNSNGYDLGRSIATENGEIVILAERDIRHTGTIAGDGGEGVSGGDVHLRAGGSIELSGQSVVSARGRGAGSAGGTVVVYAADAAERLDEAVIDVRGGDVSGDGGFAELSARRHVGLHGGGFRAGATDGAPGRALIDPEQLELTADDFSDGGDLEYTATKKITVAGGVTISSRDLTDVDSEDHETANSTGDSGAIDFEAPKIDVGDGAKILAHVEEGSAHSAGDVTLDAVDSHDGEWGQAFYQNVHANAAIDIGDATIRGGNVELNATSSTSKLAKVEEDIDSSEENELTYQLDDDSVLNLSVGAAAVIAHSDAAITIAGGAKIFADGFLDVDAEASATAQAITLSRYLGVTYGFAKPTVDVWIASGAELAAGGDVNVSGVANGTLATTLVVPGLGDPGNISIAYGKTRVNSTVEVEDGASVSGANVTFAARNSAYQSATASGFSLQVASAGAGVAVAVGDYDATAKAQVDADVRATGDLTVSAISHNLNKDTRASSLVLSPLGDLSSVQSVRSKISSQPADSSSGTSSFQMGAGITFVESSNVARATIGSGADVVASGDLDLIANAEDNFQASAQGTAGEASTAVGGAVLIANYNNKAYARIHSGAKVDVGKQLLVDAYAEVPNQITFLEFGKEYPDDEEGVEDFFSFLEALLPYLNFTLGVESQVATHYVHAEATSSSSEGGDLNIAGMANVLDVDNIAEASIEEDAEINQRAQYATDEQAVQIRAEGKIETIEIAGMASILNIFYLGAGTTGADNGVGGAYNQVTYTNDAKAYIDDGAVVDARTDVSVTADTDNYLVEIGQAGDQSAENGLSGAFSVFTIEGDTIAYIDDGATVDAGGDVSVKADHRVRSYNINGGISLAKNAGVGLSVSYIGTDTTIKAFIGDADDDPEDTRGTVDAGGGVTLDGESTYELYSLAVSGAVPKGTATSAATSEYGVGISGDAAVNEVDDVVRAYIDNVDVAATEDVAIGANSEIVMVAAGGTFAFNENLGIGGSYAHNILDRDTLAYTTNAAVAGANVALDSTARDRIITVSAGAAGAKQGTGIAGSAAINELGTGDQHNRTEAGLGENTDVTATGNVEVASDDELDLISIAGAIGASGGSGVGVGVALGIDLIYKDVRSYLGPSSSVFSTGGNVIFDAHAEQDTVTVVVAGAGSAQDFAGVGSAAAHDATILVEAVIEDGTRDEDDSTDDTASDVEADGTVVVAADSDATVTNVAGAAAYGSSGAIGAATSNVLRDEKVRARIGKNAHVAAKGDTGTVSVKDGSSSMADLTGVAVAATSDETISNIAAGGAVSGNTVSLLGSVTVTTLDETTIARIDDGAVVGHDTANDEQSVNVLAVDDTVAVDVAGAAAFGGTAGIGIGVDVLAIEKTTEAGIGDSADVAAADDIRVRALATEDLTSVSGALAAAQTTGLASSISVIDLRTDTDAWIGESATVAALGSIAVVADDDNEIDIGAGNAAFGGSVGIGAAVAVVTVDKSTHATIGSDADITALGTRDAISAPTGEFVVSYVDEADDDVASPAVEDEVDGETADGKQRITDVGESAIKGLAVTATNRDDIESIAVSGGASGNTAVNVAANVSDTSNDTIASVGSGTTINLDNTGAGDEQSVRVAAGNDFYRLGVSGLLSSGGAVGVAPGVDVAVVDNTTKAYIDSGAFVQVDEDVVVLANAMEDLLSVVAGLGLGGQAAIAGSVTAVVIDNETSAFIGEDAAVDADGNVLVAAADDTTSKVASGAGAVGSTGVGGSVAVGDIKKLTTAYVGTDAWVNARGNSANTIESYSGGEKSGGEFATEDTRGLVVRAGSSEDALAVAIAGAGGFYAGVAGAVTVNTIDSDTVAFISDGADINTANDGAHADQDVNVSAANVVDIEGIDGAIGGAVFGGIAGSVDVADLQNSTSAFIANGADVTAADDVNVNALSDSELDSVVVSAAGGIVGIAGSVGVYSMVPDLSADSTSELTTDSGDHGSVNEYVDAQLSDDSVGAAIDEVESDDLADASDSVDGLRSQLGVTDSLESTSSPDGTSAFVGDGAGVTAGGGIGITARSLAEIDGISGSVVGGVVGVGAGVAVGEIEHDTQASVGSAAVLEAGGDIEILADQNNDIDVTGFAGSIGIGAVQAAVATVDDRSDAEASIGDDAEILTAAAVAVHAMADRRAKTEANGVGVGAAAAGASFSEGSIRGSTKAFLGDGVQIGQTAVVDSLSVLAFSDLNVNADAWAASGGIGAGSGNDADATISEDVDASIGSETAIEVADGVSVDAATEHEATAEVFGLSVGGVSVDVSLAKSRVTNDVSVTVGDASVIDAGTGDLAIRARRNVDDSLNSYGSKKSKAKAESSVGTLVGGNGADATARSEVDVLVNVGSDAELRGANVTVGAWSDVISDADADGNAYGVAAGGATNAKTVINHSNAVELGSGTVVDATDDIVIAARGALDGDANAHGGSGGVVAGASTDAKSEISDYTSLIIGGDASLNAIGRIDVDTVASYIGFAKGDIDTGGAVTTNLTTSKVDLDADIESYVDGGASLVADVLDLFSGVDEVDLDSKARSKTFAANSATTAESDVDARIATVMSIGSDVVLTGIDTVDIVAALYADRIATDSDANSKIGAGVTGTVVAKATNNLDLDADMYVEEGTEITTETLYVEATTPIGNDPWGRDADAEAKTVIQYVTELVKVVEKKTKKIPLVGKIVKWVTKTVEKVTEVVLNSDEKATVHGAYASDSSLDFNADVYQSGLNDPRLVIGEDGSIEEQVNVVATIAAGVVTVEEITGTPLTVELNAVGGSVSGESTVYFDNLFASVSLINKSHNNFNIGDVNVVGDNGLDPDIQVSADENTLTIDEVVLGSTTAVNIENRTSSDIVLSGAINVFDGPVNIQNWGGGIFGGVDQVVVAHAVALEAPGSAVGTSALPILLDLVETDVEASLSAVGNDGLYLDLVARADRVEGAAGVDDPMTGVELAELRSGADIALALGAGVLTVFGESEGDVDPPETTTMEPVTYTISGTVEAAGDIDIVADALATLQLDGVLSRGFADIALDIAADGTIGSGQVGLGSDPAAGVIELGDLSARDGDVTIDATLTGSGTIRVLDGYAHVDIRNSADEDLIIGDIDLSERAMTVVTINSAVQTVPGSYGGISLESSGYAEGEVTVENLGSSDVILTGVIDNPSGLVDIANSGGDIIRDISGSRALGIQRVIADSLSLAAAAGSLGASDPLEIAISGTVSALAAGDVRLTEVLGDMQIAEIVALAGVAQLTAAGAIVEATPAGVAVVSGNRVELLAQGGGIGSAGNRFEIDAAEGGFAAGAAESIVVSEVEGDLFVDVVVADAGVADLAVPGGAMRLGYVAAPDVVTLAAAGDIVDGDARNDIRSADVVLQSGGAIGAWFDVLEVDAAFGLPGSFTATAAEGVFAVDTDGDFHLANVDGGTGDVWLFTLFGDIVLGRVATTGEVKLRAVGSIVDGQPDEGKDVVGSEATLLAISGAAGSERIGSVAAPIRLESERVSANAVGDIHLAADADLGIVEVVSANGDISLVAGESIVDASTSAAANVRGTQRIDLTALDGSIGEVSSRRMAIAGGGEVFARSELDTSLLGQDGDLRIAALEVGRDGEAFLRHADADFSIGSVRAPRLDLQLVEGDARIESLTVDYFNARAAGAGNEIRVDAFEGYRRIRNIEVAADRIVLNGLNSRFPVRFTLLGNRNDLAEYVEVTGAMRQTTRIDLLHADEALIDIVSSVNRHNRILLRNVLLRSGATVRNSDIETRISGDITEEVRGFSFSRAARAMPRRYQYRIIDVQPRSTVRQQDARINLGESTEGDG